MSAEDLDDVVQGLAIAKYALEAGDEQAASDAIDAALVTARRLLSQQRSEGLVRSRPARS